MNWKKIVGWAILLAIMVLVGGLAALGSGGSFWQGALIGLVFSLIIALMVIAFGLISS